MNTHLVCSFTISSRLSVYRVTSTLASHISTGLLLYTGSNRNNQFSFITCCKLHIPLMEYIDSQRLVPLLDEGPNLRLDCIS